MGINRRQALMSAGAGVVGFAGGTAAGYFGQELLTSKREAVPGFQWTDNFGTFTDEELRQQSPQFDGDPEARLRHPKGSPTVALLGVLATDLVSGFATSPRARLGFVYTDPGGTWHPGMGRPGQLFGGFENFHGDPYVVAALGIGVGDVEMSWALQAGERAVGLPTVKIDVIPRSDLAQKFPGVPAL